MPITFSFDIAEDSVNDANDRTRIRQAFARLGWEHVGGSTWRYPALDAEHPSEDWLNHVVPALAYFRSLIEHSGMVVTRYSVEAHSSAAFRSQDPEIGARPRAAAGIDMYPPQGGDANATALTESRLRSFISDAAESLE